MAGGVIVAVTAAIFAPILAPYLVRNGPTDGDEWRCRPKTVRLHHPVDVRFRAGLGDRLTAEEG